MRIQSTIRRTIELGILAAAAAAPLHGAGCGAAAVKDGQAFTLRRIVADPVLHRSWAVYQDCAHPERPLELRPVVASSLSAPSAAPSRGVSWQSSIKSESKIPARASAELLPPGLPAPAATKPPDVRAGDRVHLWSAGDHVRLDIEAVALEYGHAGQVIHLRRLSLGATPGTMLAGVVDGPGSAELIP